MSLAPGAVMDRLEASLYDRLYVGRRISTPLQTLWARGVRRNTELVVIDHGDERPLELRPGGPSPTGFEWGYAGAGPRETARTILWEHTGNEPDRATYQAFMVAFLASAPEVGFAIAAIEVDAFLAVHEAA